MEILHFKELGLQKVLSRIQFECVTVYLVIDNFVYVPSDALPIYQILSNRTIG